MEIRVDGLGAKKNLSPEDVAKDRIGEESNWENIFTSYLTMVCVDPQTRKSAKVNKLLPESEEEKRKFQEGERHRKQRSDLSATSLKKVAPTLEELTLVHNLFIDGEKGLNGDKMAISQTQKQTLLICQPQAIHTLTFLY